MVWPWVTVPPLEDELLDELEDEELLLDDEDDDELELEPPTVTLADVAKRV
jgi:hypothetical protein